MAKNTLDDAIAGLKDLAKEVKRYCERLINNAKFDRTAVGTIVCQIRKWIFDRQQLRHRFIPPEHPVDGCDRFGTGDLTFRVEQPIGTAL